MTFDELLDQILDLLRRERRVSYRGLQRRFALDEAYLEDLKTEIIKAKRLAVDEDGEVLVWIGAAPVQSSKFQVPSSPLPPAPETPNFERRTSQPPISYTPTHLAERILAEHAALQSRASAEGERKTITALFADLKGSTALIEGLDPEEARAIIDPALHIMMDAVHRYEGYVAQALGDGIFALFGAPIAREDHPQRALYAALRMQDEMRRYGDTLRLRGGPPLSMRVGVNTGEVVVRSIRKEDLQTDYVPVGHSTNLAARMEQMAMPGSTLVTEYTHKLTNGYFAFTSLGAATVKGREEPLQVYELMGVGPLRTRLQVSAQRGLTQFVGRSREIDQLQQTLAQAKTGYGQIVGVVGESGVGKSRLVYEFKRSSLTDCLVLEAYAVAHGQASPYLPMIELLRQYFQLHTPEDERQRKEKVLGKVLTLDRSLEDIVPYLFALLSIEDATLALPPLDPQLRRRQTFAALKRLFLRESLNQPLVLICEDLHWVDSETQGVLDALSDSIGSARVLLLVNYRPEYRHEWGPKTYYTQLRLAPFGKGEAEEFLDALLGEAQEARPTSPLRTLKQQILEKTEGTAFFIEEIVQELFERGVLVRDGTATRQVASLPAALQLPTTVQGVLSARIDRLPAAEKALVQQLAVIGRRFSLGLMQHVIALPEDEQYRLLSALQSKEFLYEQPAFPEVEYVFKHALTQDVAYNSLLQEQRKAVHERAARAIEALYGSTVDDHYNELAYHYTQSGDRHKAVEYLHLAGQQAVQRSANTEAIKHFTIALELLTGLPDTPERARRELSLQIALGVPLQVSKGPAAAELADVYSRALDLCQQVGEPGQRFSVLRGLWVLHHVRAELDIARTLADELLHMAEQAQDSTLLLEAHRALGSTSLWLGEFAKAWRHLERAGRLYNSQQHRFLTFLHGGADPGVSCLCDGARALWFLGYPDQALTQSEAALALAQELSDPFSLAYALIFAAGLHQLRREGRETQQRAEEGIALALEHGFATFVSAGTIRRGWALAEQGHTEEGLGQMERGVVARRTAGAELGRPYFLALQAEVYGKVGRPEHGLALLTEALDQMHATNEFRLAAEVHRLHGELTLQKSSVVSSQWSVPDPRHPTLDPQGEAEACFLKAIEIAREQHAKSLELRAAMSLVRLRQQQLVREATCTAQPSLRAARDQAHTLLREVYNWFTEGFATKDLREAKVVLEQLRD
jgi:class 3 adenylate cyclase/predicted ATPase